MVLQGGPEVPKWPPGCARGAKMVSQNVEMDAPSLPNGNPRSQKWPATEGVALKIKLSTFPYSRAHTTRLQTIFAL